MNTSKFSIHLKGNNSDRLILLFSQKMRKIYIKCNMQSNLYEQN